MVGAIGQSPAGRSVNWEGEPAPRFPLPTLATKVRVSLLPFPTDL
jgi:hypothetical protein